MINSNHINPGWIGFFGNGQTVSNPTTASDLDGTVKAAAEWLGGTRAKAKQENRKAAFVYLRKTPIQQQLGGVISRSLTAAFQKAAGATSDQMMSIFRSAVSGIAADLERNGLECAMPDKDRQIFVMRRRAKTHAREAGNT